MKLIMYLCNFPESFLIIIGVNVLIPVIIKLILSDNLII